MKPTICLVTNWYPTKENEFQGQFFKEQAFALAEYYDFIVVHYREKSGPLPSKRIEVTKVNEEHNTVEYDVLARIPYSDLVLDIIHTQSVSRSKVRQIEGVGKYLSAPRIKHTRYAITRVFEQYFSGSIDVLYCVDAQMEAFYVQVASQTLGIPYVIGEHAPVPWPGTVIDDVSKRAIESANAFLAISNDKIRQLMLQNIRLPKTYYVGNLVDETAFELKEQESEVPTLIIVAANSYYKNYPMFIDVINRLMVICDRPFNVMVVGYASNRGYSKNVEQLEEAIAQSSFGSIAELIPSVPHSELHKLLARASAFVMTSIQEGQPVSALEAACCGLPVFSTRCGGVEDYVGDDIGRIYDVADVEGMAQGLNDFIRGSIRFDRRRIRDSVVQRFGRDAFTKSFRKAFDDVLGTASTK